MNVLIGDIGNTITKICLIKAKDLKINKIFYVNSQDILKKNSLKRKLKKILKKQTLSKVALFSSVVPKYQSLFKKLLNKFYKVKLREIKNKNIHKIIKIDIKNKNQIGSDRIANAVGVYKKYRTNKENT